MNDHQEKKIIIAYHVPLRSENEPYPSKVGTSAALGLLPSSFPCKGWTVLSINCFKSFTKWSLVMWGYLVVTQNEQ